MGGPWGLLNHYTRGTGKATFKGVLRSLQEGGGKVKIGEESWVKLVGIFGS